MSNFHTHYSSDDDTQEELANELVVSAALHPLDELTHQFSFLDQLEAQGLVNAWPFLVKSFRLSPTQAREVVRLWSSERHSVDPFGHASRVMQTQVQT